MMILTTIQTTTTTTTTRVMNRMPFMILHRLLTQTRAQARDGSGAFPVRFFSTSKIQGSTPLKREQQMPHVFKFYLNGHLMFRKRIYERSSNPFKASGTSANNNNDHVCRSNHRNANNNRNRNGNTPIKFMLSTAFRDRFQYLLNFRQRRGVQHQRESLGFDPYNKFRISLQYGGSYRKIIF